MHRTGTRLRRSIAALFLLPAFASSLAAEPAPPAPEAASLEEAFRLCIGLKKHPLAGPLLDTVRDEQARESFAARHPAAVEDLFLERGPGYSTITARLKPGVSVAGIPVQAIYAATCERQCALALWGLELGTILPTQRAKLLQWVDAAPTTPTDFHGDIKVQVNKTTDGRTVLVCDVSG